MSAGSGVMERARGLTEDFSGSLEDRAARPSVALSCLIGVQFSEEVTLTSKYGAGSI